LKNLDVSTNENFNKMLTSIEQVNIEFFKLFHGITVPNSEGEVVVIEDRYTKKSSKDYVEENANQIYPCIAIADDMPSLKEDWWVDLHGYIEGYDTEGLTAYLYQNPLWMEFVYDVSIASKEYKQFIKMKDYFLANFLSKKAFLFDKKLTGEDSVGDVVGFTIRSTDIPRTDGVFETNFEFTLSPWLHVGTPEEVELIRELVINSEPTAGDF